MKESDALWVMVAVALGIALGAIALCALLAFEIRADRQKIHNLKSVVCGSEYVTAVKLTPDAKLHVNSARVDC